MAHRQWKAATPEKVKQEKKNQIPCLEEYFEIQHKEEGPEHDFWGAYVLFTKSPGGHANSAGDHEAKSIQVALGLSEAPEF